MAIVPGRLPCCAGWYRYVHEAQHTQKHGEKTGVRYIGGGEERAGHAKCVVSGMFAPTSSAVMSGSSH